MAKKSKRADTRESQPAGVVVVQAAESKLEEFAEDLGRLLGSAQAKAEGWIGQRNAITDELTQIRDAAQNWIAELSGGGTEAGVQRRGPGRPASSSKVRARSKRGPGRPPATAVAPATREVAPKQRTISPEGRERIAAAQRARWAKQKKAAGRSAT